MSKKQKNEIRNKNEHILVNKVYFKYLMMKIRHKISYMAFEKMVTINEIFFETIVKSYNSLIDCGDIVESKD